MNFHIYCVVVVMFLLLKPVNNARILGFFATITRSHFIVEEPVMRELAKRGHDVTVVTSFRGRRQVLENYRHIQIPDFINNTAFETYRTKATSGQVLGLVDRLNIMEPLMRVSLDIMNHKMFLPLKNETFDLLILGWFMNDYALGLSGHFKCPSVVISANVNFYSTRKFSGNPNSISTVPSPFSNIKTPMTFLQRIQNIYFHLMEFFFVELVSYLYVKPMYLEAFPSDKYPSLKEVEQNVSLILLAQHFSGRTPEALLPGIIEVEGMHVKRHPSPLPRDIKEFLDSATDGAIFFSLGSNARSSDLSLDKITALLNIFTRLKQKVLWKYETTLLNLPDNVKIRKWFPQDDILAHENVKLFISHCGKGGITEAKYHGVPILGIPLYGDQFGNAEIIRNEGWAVVLPLNDLNEVTFSETLEEVLDKPSYAHNAKLLANLNRDRPEHPMDKAIFWIEYVIRHNGAKHMQSPAIHLNLLQYYMVDIFVFMFLLLYVIIKLLKLMTTVFKVLLKRVFNFRSEKIKKE